MRTLANLADETRPPSRRKRVGRGPSSGHGKTSCRGGKGASARSGYKRRFGYEGGQMRLFMKIPQRGFSVARFQRRMHSVNLVLIDRYFVDGEPVNEATLRRHGLVTGHSWGIKILGEGELTKRLVSIEVDAISAEALRKVEAANIPLTLRRRFEDDVA